MAHKHLFPLLLNWGRGMVFPCMLGLSASPVWALNADGPLQNMLIDASLGEYSAKEARSVLNNLNRSDLSAYSAVFGRGHPSQTVPLNLSSDVLDKTLAAYEQQGLDLTRLTGPDGKVVFGAEEATCNGNTLNLENNAVAATEGCLGIRSFLQSRDAATAAAMAQINTIDLLIFRPTSQFMIDIRRFVARHRRAEGESNEANEGGGGASGDEPSLLNGPWGLYFNGGGNFGDINSAPNRTGFGINSQFGTGGFDYRFSEAAVAGVLFNYTGSQANIAGDLGSVNGDTYRFLPFVSLTPFENAYVDILAGYSYHTYNGQRYATHTQASAEYSADQALAAINLGYIYSMGSFDLTGYAGGSYIGTNVSGYTEQGLGTLLSVGGYSVSSWTSTLGTEIEYAHSTSFGVLKPHLRLEWVHEFANNTNNISVFVPAQGLVVNVARAPIARDWGKIAAGVQALLPHGITGFVNYEAQVMSAGQNNLVEGGLRFEF